MAKQLNVNLAFSADTSKVKAQLQDLQNQLNKLTLSSKTELGITKDIEDASRAAAELSVHLKNATNQQTGTLDFSKLNQSIKQSGTSLQQYGRTLQSLGPQGQQAFMSLAQAVANSEVPIRRTNAMLKEMGTALANTARWQLSSSMLHGFMGAVQSAYGYAQDLNESLNNIRIVTGQNIDQMAKFAEEANKAARALSTTTTEYTNASLIYYQQGLNDQQVKERTDITIKMANVARQSAEVVSDQMTAVWNNFYDGSKSLEHYADVMTALGAATASSTDEIAEGLNKFAAVADTVGLSYEYAASALATVTATTRQSADVVGTAFKTLFARIQDLELGKTLDDGTTLGSYSQALAKVGVQIKDTSGEMKSMDAILEEMAAKWDTLGKAEQIALAQSVAGVRQYTQLIALMDNWDFMEKNLATSNTSSGALQKHADTYAESWEAARDRVRAAAEGVYKSLINDEFFIDVLNNIEKIISFVDHLIDNLGGLKGVLMAVGAIATKVFSAQLSQGLTNMVYNIRMMTKAGREAEQNARKKVIDDAIEGIPQSKEFSTQTEKAEKESMRSQLTLQQEMMANADRMNAMEQARNQMLLDRNKVLQEQAILAAKAEDAAIQQKGQAVDVVQTRVAANFGNDQQFQLEILRKITAETGKMKESFRSHSEIDALFTAFKQGGEASKESVKQLQNQIIELKSGNPAVQALIDSMKDYDLTVDNVEENITTLKAQIKALITDSAATLKADIIPEEQMQEGSIEIDNLVNSIEKQIQAEIRRKNAVEDGTKAHKAASQAIQDSTGNQKQWADIIVESANFAFSAASALQMLGGAFDQLRDPDVSGWQKFLTVLTTLGMVVPTLISLWTTFKKLLSQETIAKIANVAATLAQAAAEKKAAQAREEGSSSTKKNIAEIWRDTKEKLSKKGQNIKNTWNDASYKKSGDRFEQIRQIKNKDGQLVNVMKDKTTGKFMTEGAAKNMVGKEALGHIGKMAGGVALIGAGIAVAVGAVKWGIAQFNKYSDAAKEAAKQAQEAATAYQAVSDSYNTFTSNLSAYQDAQSGLKDMTKGTLEYREAVLKANESAMQLLDTYEDLEYTVDADGLIIINETSLEQAREKQLELLENAQRAKQLADQNAKNKELKAESVEFQREELNSSQGTLLQVGNAAAATAVGTGSGALIGAGIGMLGGPIGALIGAGIGAIAGAITGVVGSVTAGAAANEEEEAINRLAEVYATAGNAQFATDEAFEKLLREDLKLDDEALIKSLVDNRESTLELVKEVSANTEAINAQNAAVVQDYFKEQLSKSGLSEEQQAAIAGRSGALLDEKTEELYENKYKDKFGGKTDATIQKAYAEAMGWATDTIDNQTGNKAKYFNKDGTEVGIISDEVARRYLAEQEALKKLTGATTTLINKFKELTNSSDKYDKALLSYLENKNFAGLTEDEYNDLYQLIIGKVNDGDKLTQDDVKQYINDIFNNGEALTDTDAQNLGLGFKTAEALYNDFFDKFSLYDEQRKTINDNITYYAQNLIKTLPQDQLKNISNQELSEMGQQINRAYIYGGEEGAKYIVDAFYKEAGVASTKLSKAFANIDWSTADVKTLSQTLTDYGISIQYTDEELRNLISYMSNEGITSLNEFQQQVKSLSDVSGLSQGSIIDQEAYNQLPEELQTYFSLMSDGTHQLTADALDFYQAVSNASKQSFQEAKNDYEKALQDLQNLKMKDFNYYTQQVGPQSLRDYINNIPTTYDEYFIQFLKSQGVSDTGGNWRQVWATDSGGSVVLSNSLDQSTGKSGYDVRNKEGEIIGAGEYYWNSEAWQKAEGNNKQAMLNNASPFFGESAKNDIDIINNQLELLRKSSWGASESGIEQIATWQDALNAGYLTLQQSDDILAKVREVGEEGYDALLGEQKILEEEFQSLRNSYALSLNSMKDRQLALQSGDINLDAYNMAAGAAINQERWEDLDVAQVSEYAEYLEDAFDMSEEGAEEAARVIMKMNKGIEVLSESFENWSDIVENSSEDSYEYFEAMNGIKTSLSDILDISEEFISNDFIKDHMDKIREAAEGDEKAIDDLKKALADQIILDIFEVDSLDQLSIDLQSKITTLKDWIDKNPLKIGATIDTANMNADEAAFLKSCQEVIAAAGMTVEQANAYFSQMGYSTEFETAPQPVKRIGYETITQSEVKENHTVTTPDGNEITYPGVTVTKTYQGNPYELTEWVDAIKMQTVTVDGKETQVPEIKSISKTPTGSSNNFSSSNVGGSSTKKAKPIKRTKKTDVVERYKEVTDKIDDVQNAMNDASKAADRLWGPSRLEAMRKANKALEENIELLKDKRAEAEYNLKVDKQNLKDTIKTNAGINITDTMFDEKGNFTAYDEVLGGLWNELSAAEKSAGETVDDHEQEKIDAIQKRIDAIKEAIDQYDDTNQIFKNLSTQVSDEIAKWQDNNYDDLNIKLEYEIAVNESELELIDYYLGRTEDNIYSFVEAMGQYEAQKNLYTDSLQAQEDHYYRLEDAYKTGEISLQAYKEGLASSQSAIISNLQSLEESKQAMQDYYGNVMSMAIEEIGLYTTEMEQLNSVLDHYSNIIEIIGKQDDTITKGKILASKANNLKNELAIQSKLYKETSADAEYWAQKMTESIEGSNEYETFKKNWQAAQQAANEAQDAMLSKTQEWAEAMKAIVENELAGFATSMEESLTGGLSFDELMTSMERRSSLQEEYLTTTNKIYETNKLMRTAQQEIDKTTNTVAKKRLQNFIRETNELQGQAKLSQYELEIQQAKYDLLLAEIALEEAQQAKSTVRLTRDSEGNFGYVYTADANAVADAEQKLADAQNNLYNIGLEGANDYQQKYAETLQESQDAITELTTMWMSGEIASEEEFNRRKQEIIEYYGEKLKQYSNLHSVALSADSRVVADAWSSDFTDMMVTTDQWKNSVDSYFKSAADSMETWAEVCATTVKESGLDDIEKSLESVDEKSKQWITTLIGEDGESGVVGALMAQVDVASKVSESAITIQDAISQTTAEYEKLLTAINDAYTAMTTPVVPPRISLSGGEYLPVDPWKTNGGNSDGTPTNPPKTYKESEILAAQKYVGTEQDGSWGRDSKAKAKAKVGSEDIGKVLEAIEKEKSRLETQRMPVYSGPSPETGTVQLHPSKIISVNATPIWETHKGETMKKPMHQVKYEHPTYGAQTGYITSDGYTMRQDYYKAMAFLDTGGYTGSWGTEGKIAMLHEKELVLNADDTTNFLASLEVLREIVNTINLHSMNAQLGGLLSTPRWVDADQSQILEQQVHIEASFPGVQDRNEIEEAFNNLINRASQFVNRK